MNKNAIVVFSQDRVKTPPMETCCTLPSDLDTELQSEAVTVQRKLTDFTSNISCLRSRLLALRAIDLLLLLARKEAAVSVPQL